MERVGADWASVAGVGEAGTESACMSLTRSPYHGVIAGARERTKRWRLGLAPRGKQALTRFTYG